MPRAGGHGDEARVGQRTKDRSERDRSFSRDPEEAAALNLESQIAVEQQPLAGERVANTDIHETRSPPEAAVGDQDALAAASSGSSSVRFSGFWPSGEKHAVRVRTKLYRLHAAGPVPGEFRSVGR